MLFAQIEWHKLERSTERATEAANSVICSHFATATCCIFRLIESQFFNICSIYYQIAPSPSLFELLPIIVDIVISLRAAQTTCTTS